MHTASLRLWTFRRIEISKGTSKSQMVAFTFLLSTVRSALFRSKCDHHTISVFAHCGFFKLNAVVDGRLGSYAL